MSISTSISSLRSSLWKRTTSFRAKREGKEKESVGLKDIEGHQNEKILTSKLSEKAIEEKWKREEEELERIRIAK